MNETNSSAPQERGNRKHRVGMVVSDVQNSRVGVESEVGAVFAADLRSGSDDDALDDVALLDSAARDGFLDSRSHSRSDAESGAQEIQEGRESPYALCRARRDESGESRRHGQNRRNQTPQQAETLAS